MIAGFSGSQAAGLVSKGPVEGPVNSCHYGVESIIGNKFKSTRFTQDVVPLTDLKANPGRIVKHVAEVHRPVLLTSRGRGVAVVQSIVDYEEAQEERAFMRAVVEGLADLEAGREVSIKEAKRRLGLR